MWWDALRRQLRFADLQVDFRTIVLDSEPRLCLYSVSEPEQAVPWTKVLDRLKNMDSVQFRYTLGVVKTAEDEYFSYEYDGSPLAIADDIGISAADQDVDIIDIQDNDPVGNVDTIPDLTSTLTLTPTPYKRISEALTKFEGGLGNARVASQPEDFFVLPAQAEEMLEYHNGYDDFFDRLLVLCLPTT